MEYQSTRSSAYRADSVTAVLDGIAPDGGLYIADPSKIAFDWKAALGCSSRDMSASILHALLPDFPDMRELVERAYLNKFETEDLTPTVKVGDRYILELFRGPTSAFKDVALSVLPQLVTAGRALQGAKDDVVILTATSGDTGKAALEGFHDVPGTRIVVFYPYKGVSRVQELQMSTQKGANVKVCAVRGNFDDAQTGVKKVFAACRDMDLGGKSLSSANSINIGRLAPQVMYYFRAYADLVSAGRIRVGDTVHYVVPTGNFGDILAGWFAKLLGLPVGTLVCASNQNKVLTDFITTGVYDKRREFYKTNSPSMDILVSSNLERLLFLLSEDEGYVAGLMKKLSEEGRYEISEELLRKLQNGFAAGTCDDESSIETIGKVFREYGYLMDPHTAVAWNVCDCFMDSFGDEPVVVLSTASPYKFPAACLRALGEEPEEDEFAVMRRLNELSGVPVPANLANLESAEVLHTDVIEKEDMLAYVLEILSK
ncbi:MAG: threonine synthase [Oscillospiraceae bacterium]|nr:threonine synthase [Oscillospiraceae bacterium]